MDIHFKINQSFCYICERTVRFINSFDNKQGMMHQMRNREWEAAVLPIIVE